MRPCDYPFIIIAGIINFIVLPIAGVLARPRDRENIMYIVHAWSVIGILGGAIEMRAVRKRWEATHQNMRFNQ